MKLKYIFTIIAITLFTGCDFLDEYAKDRVFVHNPDDLDELILGDGYMDADPCRGYDVSNGYYPYIHLMDDDILESAVNKNGGYQGYNLRDPMFGYYTWQVRVGVNETGSSFANESKDWNRIYGHINVVNSILDIVDGIGSTPSEKAQALRIKGEASFLRAAYYFTLVNLYGKPYSEENASTDGVSLKLVGEVIDIKYDRKSVGAAYKQILKDLEIAEKCLEVSEKMNTIYRADIVACYLLQSRVYLYMQNWSEALRYAEKVIAVKGDLRDLNGFDYKQGFLSKSSPETIFSMGSSTLSCAFNNGLKFFGITSDLYNTYESDDLRRDKFMFEYEGYVGLTKLSPIPSHGEKEKNDPQFWMFMYNNYGYNGRQVEVSDHFLMRTAEAFLNGAEAAAYMDDETTAKRLLEGLRKKRIDESKYAAVNLTGEALVKFIRDERRRELCFEGHRWFDLRRYLVCEHYPESKEIKHIYYQYAERRSVTVVQKREYVLQPYDPAYTLPIPFEVLDFNTGMKNNERPERQPNLLPL